jgi:L-ribulose-5-phosphate 3-epimerase UlaE
MQNCAAKSLVRRSRAKRKQIIMKAETTDQPILKSIQRLMAEEHRLFAQEVRTDPDHARLSEINVELDQCWDLLRQRQALRDAGGNPNKADNGEAGDRRKLRRMI